LQGGDRFLFLFFFIHRLALVDALPASSVFFFNPATKAQPSRFQIWQAFACENSKPGCPFAIFPPLAPTRPPRILGSRGSIPCDFCQSPLCHSFLFDVVVFCWLRGPFPSWKEALGPFKAPRLGCIQRLRARAERTMRSTQSSPSSLFLSCAWTASQIGLILFLFFFFFPVQRRPEFCLQKQCFLTSVCPAVSRSRCDVGLAFRFAGEENFSRRGSCPFWHN